MYIYFLVFRIHVECRLVYKVYREHGNWLSHLNFITFINITCPEWVKNSTAILKKKKFYAVINTKVLCMYVEYMKLAKPAQFYNFHKHNVPRMGSK